MSDTEMPAWGTILHELAQVDSLPAGVHFVDDFGRMFKKSGTFHGHGVINLTANEASSVKRAGIRFPVMVTKDFVGPAEPLEPWKADDTEDCTSTPDMVNHPPHYTGFSNGAEVIDIIENLPHNRGAAIKYLARAGSKDPEKLLEDLRKAEWYVKREIARLGG